MSDSFVKLSCPTCTHALDVYEDMQSFFCASCGAAIIAARRGGTVTLTTASTAGIRDDVQSLSRQKDEILARQSLQKRQGFQFGGGLLLAGFLLVRLGIASLLGLCVLLAGMVMIMVVRRKAKSGRMDVRLIQAKIDALAGRIA